jgi:hypothetical protein
MTLRTLNPAALMLVFGLVASGCEAPAADQHSAADSVIVPAGRYIGSLTIADASPCEMYYLGGDGRRHAIGADVFLTVDPKGSRLLLEDEVNNTAAGDYFETGDGTLALSPGRMVGGKRHASLYYFDMKVRRDRSSGSYVATGTWIIQDQCEQQAPAYRATMTFRPRPA